MLIMEDLCSGCLCSGRKLRLIGDTDFYQLYHQILNEISLLCVDLHSLNGVEKHCEEAEMFEDYIIRGHVSSVEGAHHHISAKENSLSELVLWVQTSQICIRICWECSALLKKFEHFKAQVKRNYSELLWNMPPNSQPPHLTTTNIYNLSFPEPIFHQPIQLNNVVKEEGDEDIKTEDEPVMFVNDLPLAEDNDDKPAKKSKKKTKIKKPSRTKVKVKKKKTIKKSTPAYMQQLPETQHLPESQQSQQAPEFPETEQLPETDDGVSDREMIDDSFQDEDDKPLKDVKLNEDDEVKENSTNGVTKPIKTKAAVPKPKMELLPDKPQCVECGKTFSSRKTYRYHLNVLHKGNNQYPCPRCGKIYQWKSNLGRHMRTHKAVDDGELYCEQCDKSFASVATYRQHLRISRRHVSENEFSFTCNECGKKFVNKTRLRDHVDWEHLKKIKFRCQLCNKPFKCHTSLYVHLQNVHRNKEKKDNLCHVCGKSYQNAAKLKYHIIALHTGETPYQCSQCSAAFGWYSSLYRHIREVHYKVKSQPKKSKKAKKLEIEPPPYMNYHP